jgi:hypothetical protein
MPWWSWVLTTWAGIALLLALPVALVIREAERRERGGAAAGAPPIVLPPERPALPARRRRIPVPPIAATLVTTGLTLEVIGLMVRLADQDRGPLRTLSMDLPLSVPRMFVAALFAVAALAAFVGSSRVPGRRVWWVAVGLVATVLAEVKGGGTVHVSVLQAFGVGDRPLLAAAGSTLVVAAVLGGLFWVSRAERRDRRRVLLALGLYAVAAVGLSGVSSLTDSLSSPVWPALATFVEESGEVLGAVAVLMAVLVGVAPRLVLPADWALRRTADALTVDAPGVAPDWSAGVPSARW